MTSPWPDDDDLMAALGAALQAEQEVPRAFLTLGKAAFAWHNIDAELARLVSDSRLADPAERASAGVRSGGSSGRSLAFATSVLSIELDLASDALRGQIAPAQSGTVQVRSDDETVRDVPIDELGWFVIRPVPAGPFRLSIRGDSGASALTEWIAP